MKNLLLLCLFLLPLIGFCQEKKVSFGFEGSLNWTDNIYTYDSSVPNAIVSVRQEIEKGSLGFDLGGIFSIQLKDKLELQTGLKLLYAKTLTPKRQLRWGSQHDGNGGWEPSETEDPSLAESYRYSANSYYIELPVRLNLQLSGKLNAFKLSLGQSPTINFLNTSKSVLYYSDRTEKEVVKDDLTPYRRLNFNTQVGFIWEKQLKKGNAFYLFPNARMQTLGRVRSAGLNRRFIQFSLSAGIQI